MLDISASLTQLRDHLTKVNQAITALEAVSYSSTNTQRRGRLKGSHNVIPMGTTNIKRRGRPPGIKNKIDSKNVVVAKKSRVFTPAQRKQQAARMKAYWAAKKKAS